MPGFAGQAEKTFNGTPGRASTGYIEIGASLRTWFPAKFAIQREIAESHTCDRTTRSQKPMLSQSAVRRLNRQNVIHAEPLKASA